MDCKSFLLALLLPFAALSADLPDVTLQPWTVRTIDYTPGSFGSTHSLTDTSGLVVLYSTDSFGGAPPQISTDFGATWKRLYQVSIGLRTQQIRVLDYVSSDSTAFN